MTELNQAELSTIAGGSAFEDSIELMRLIEAINERNREEAMRETDPSAGW